MAKKYVCEICGKEFDKAGECEECGVQLEEVEEDEEEQKTCPHDLPKEDCEICAEE